MLEIFKNNKFYKEFLCVNESKDLWNIHEYIYFWHEIFLIYYLLDKHVFEATPVVQYNKQMGLFGKM